MATDGSGLVLLLLMDMATTTTTQSLNNKRLLILHQHLQQQQGSKSSINVSPGRQGDGDRFVFPLLLFLLLLARHSSSLVILMLLHGCPTLPDESPPLQNASSIRHLHPRFWNQPLVVVLLLVLVVVASAFKDNLHFVSFSQASSLEQCGLGLCLIMFVFVSFAKDWIGI
ncbi:hypothetical protein O6H91_19G047100 [Diphasiastrum complanatum]|uniref:Uncharacterized protein n=1 Tax=Diphasiastrum complanatum TaxID=34168 RepID=A0ACC2AUV6_DIPCM|nr:hypothetical protein O6H91_19G047100 [Diphasiastrum complanatum]